MFTWTTKASPPAELGSATPLLTHLTGAFAARIAGLWPQPHAVFVTATAERRHLVCIALTRGALSVDLADGLLHWPLRRAIKVALPDAPEGLARALGVLGETAWGESAYRELLAMLAEPEAAKRLRHAATVTPEAVAALAATPLPLLRAGLDRLGLSDGQLGIVREAWDVIVARDGEAAAAAAAARWGAARSPSLLRERIGDDLVPPLPPAPLPGGSSLRPLATKAAMTEAASRYRNCLVSQIPNAAEGDAAYFEWTPAPGAIVEVRRDRLYGWILTQARLAGNASVPEPMQGAICAELKALGVHVGRPAWQLDQQLEWGLVHGHGTYALEDHVRACFVD
ncbi:MAG: hypothetical protein JWP35_3587 [Caulobacter sp.]|nr:hypothetical protein [Caulobacter sp.]